MIIIRINDIELIGNYAIRIIFSDKHNSGLYTWDNLFKLGLNETAIGMTLPVFGHQLAQNRLSKRHLTSAVIQSQMFSPEEAIDAGFLDSVKEPEDIKIACLEAAQQLMVLPTETYGQMKRDTRQAELAAIEKSLV